MSVQISSLLPFLSLGHILYYLKLYSHTQTMKVFFCHVVPENHLFHKSISHYINGKYPKDKESECWRGFIMLVLLSCPLIMTWEVQKSLRKASLKKQHPCQVL